MPQQKGLAERRHGEDMKKLLLKGTFLAYLLIGLEIFIMISPFAAYFYSVYSPFINYIYDFRYTNWITEFFLPHFVFINAPVIHILGIVQVVTIFFGLLLFFYAAIPLYYAKFTKKGIVTKGIYCKIRHPQYLGLAIAGFGLLLYWPRFLILLMYITMLFVYYLLARNEEQRMINKYGHGYIEYMNSVPMFLPKNIGGKIFELIFRRFKSKAAGLIILYFTVVLISLGSAMALRNYSISNISVSDIDGLSVISVLPMKESEINDIINFLTKDPDLKKIIGDTNPELAYIMPSDFFLMAIVTDIERLYPLEFEKPVGSNPFIRFFKIFINYTKMQIGIYHDEHPLKRIIFVSVKDSEGMPLHGPSIFLFGSRRFPLLYVDIDKENNKIISIQDVKPRHKWGDAPMPIF